MGGRRVGRRRDAGGARQRAAAPRPAASARPTAGLEALGFVPGFDCWQATIGAGHGADTRGAAILDQALPASAELFRRLTHPGVATGVPAPEPSAPAAEHLRAALRTLAAARAGKASFATGTPARNEAWAFVDGDRLTVMSDVAELDLDVALADETAVDGAAGAVAAILTGTPLFVALMDLPS